MGYYTFISTLWVSLLIVSPVVGQEIQSKQVEKFQTVFDLHGIKSNNEFKLTSDRFINSIAIAYRGDLNGSYILVNKEKIKFLKDDHENESKNGISISNLIIFQTPVTDLKIISGAKIAEISQVFTLHVPKLVNATQLKSESENCELPNLIPQEEWRSGLPSPRFNRRFTDTNHVIVHHSATSNNLTDYTNVVRNIYIFHTRTRGWSDVGYNYLIAPNGAIYAGRDPGNGEQDLVMGAHFCGRNSNTTGICLLGDLSLVAPTETALNSLEELISWKIDKDQLDPEGINNHPLNNALPVIAGHRDGCSTECPGNFTYPQLSTIRQNVISAIDACNQPEPEPEVESLTFSVGPSPAYHNFLNVNLPQEISITDLIFLDLNGKIINVPVLNEVNNSFQLDISQIPVGVYLMKIDQPTLNTNVKLVRM